MTKPIIGITADRSDDACNPEATYHLRRNYCAAVSAAGGVPIIVPYDIAAVDTYARLIDGLLITGGMFDIDPTEYGMTANHPDGAVIKADRTAFERAILQRALADNTPILGICGGMQLIAVEMGARLFQHIPSDLDTDVEHKQTASCSLGTHRIRIVTGSLLHQIMSVESLVTNSLHHQAVMNANNAICIGARADDGIIEAIDVPAQAFCLGVQWHPEYLVNVSENKIFMAFVRAAQLARKTSGAMPSQHHSTSVAQCDMT